MSISDTLRALADEAEADEASHRRVIETLAEQIDALIRENSRSATVASEYRRGLIRAAEIVEATARDNGWLVRDGYAGKFAAAIRKAVVTEKDASATESHRGCATVELAVQDSPDAGIGLSGRRRVSDGWGNFARWPCTDGGID